MPASVSVHVAQRLAAVRAKMRDAHLDALLITNPENRHYVTGFYGHDDGLDSAGRVVITADHVRLLTDGRYSEQAREEAPGIELSDQRGELRELVVATLRDWGWDGTADPRRTLGIEADHLTVATFESLSKAGNDLFVIKPMHWMVEPLRAVKDADEIAATRRATEITDQTFTHLLTYLRQPDLTEQQVAAEILATMLRLGADGAAFAPIVAGGAHGARPHAVPRAVALQPYQPIIIDMGARFGGYCADMTRTVFLDGVSDVWRDRYAHVLAAQEACERGLHGGITGKAADALARESLERAGLAAYYTHGTGHGTGLEIHEDPQLSARAPEDHVLPEGSIVTIEPGVYFPGEGGIRIEDAAVITAGGCQVLTASPKDLATMIIPRQEKVG